MIICTVPSGIKYVRDALRLLLRIEIKLIQINFIIRALSPAHISQRNERFINERRLSIAPVIKEKPEGIFKTRPFSEDRCERVSRFI